MEPTWQTSDGAVKLYLGDCLDVLPTLGGIDAVVTDPPYGMNNNNDYARFTEGPNGHGAATSRTYPPTVGDDKPFDPSPWLQFDSVILWGSNHFAARLPVGTTLVWIKRFDGGFGSFLSDAEIGWMKGGHGVYCHRDTSMYSQPEKRQHPNEKPAGLMIWCLQKTSGTILDPFMGSGTTGVACVRTGRSFIGIELEPKYFDISVKRIKAELNRFPLLEPPTKIQGRLV